VSGNTVLDNNQAGISASSGSLVTGNAVRQNSGFGLTGGGAYSNNAFYDNNGSCLNDQVGTGVEIGTNLCCGDATCP
jgi:parallel beta-helix repeat protein